MGLTIFGTSNYTSPRWVPNSTTRGTWELVQTCFLTLGLCVYSAFHPNVFHRGCKLRMQLFIRAKWLLVALLAPEFMVFNAWAQRRQAVRIAKMLRKRSGQEEAAPWLNRACEYLRKTKSRLFDQERGKQPTPAQTLQRTGPQLPEPISKIKVAKESAVSLQEASSTPKVHEERFELIHGFLVVMGGIVVDMSSDNDRVWPKPYNTLTMTSACVEECLGRPEFQDIDLSFLTREQINGRQKVDHFAKTLVVIQALWFCIQFIARIQQSLPVSLLELNTAAHSLCAIFIYILWWHKPGKIDNPFVIYTEHSEALRDLCASQWTLGAYGKFYEGTRVVEKGPKEKKQPAVAPTWAPMFLHSGSIAELLLNTFRGRRGITLCPGSGEDWYLFNHTERWFCFPHLPSTDRYHLRVCNPQQTPTVRLQFGNPIPSTPMTVSSQFLTVEVDTTTLSRWQRAFKSETYNHNYTIWLRDRQPNFAWPRGLDDNVDGPAIGEELFKSLIMQTVTSLVYGSIHMLAWNSAVLRSTGSNMILWKLACLQLMVLGPFALGIWTGLKFAGNDAHLRLSQAMAWGLSALGVAVFVAYMISRVYLLVEIFLVIPYMDEGVYKVPNFAGYLPHFG